jgi:hypothetical protein
MTPRGAILAIGAVVIAIVLAVAWYTFGTWPVPGGYAFPRHSLFGGPTALFEGRLQDVGGCIRTDGDDSFAVVWPPGYRLSIEAGEPVVRAGFREIRMGEQIRMGGGYYESGDPPPGSRDVGGCAPPFFLSTGLSDP